MLLLRRLHRSRFFFSFLFFRLVIFFFTLFLQLGKTGGGGQTL